MGDIRRALDDLRRGKFVLIYDSDGRERETDLVAASLKVGPEHVRTMRADGGGLICLTVGPEAARRLHLPYLSDVYRDLGARHQVFDALFPDDIPYDAKSSFSLSINHRRTFTGITDADRSLTISEFGGFLRRIHEFDDPVREFGKNFRSPGHVPLLIAADGLTEARQGHTELSTALVMMAGLPASAAICEMMGPRYLALSKDEAIRYARARGLQFLEGDEIAGAWKEWSW